MDGRCDLFPSSALLHYRPTGTADTALRNAYRRGLMDYSLGYDPLYELAKLASRTSLRPAALMQTCTTLAGYVYSGVSRRKRPVSKEFVTFLRKEQRVRLRQMISRPRRSSGSTALDAA